MKPDERVDESGERSLASLSFNEGQHPKIKDLATELNSLSEMLGALAGKKIKVNLAVANCPVGEVAIAPFDLTRILINLIRNCAEAFSAMGQISISASGRGRDALGFQYAVIAVEDDGLAIPLSLLDTIFDTDASHDVQGENDHRPRMRVKTRRLGLRIVRELVEASGGRVQAIRLPERGSRFEIILPMCRGKSEIAVA